MKSGTTGISNMAFDFKKEYREFYLPKAKPALVQVPPVQFVAVEGRGDPNEAGGDYQAAVSLLYALAYTVKMSKMGDHRIAGYFDFVVPPLEGFWRQEGAPGMDYSRKADLQWISCIRLPDFVAPSDFDWAVKEAQRKKGIDCSKARLMKLEEGLCVQLLHQGPYADEPASVALMDAFLAEQGYENDFDSGRLHHEIYLSDPRKTAPEKLKTVIRHPVKKKV